MTESPVQGVSAAKTPASILKSAAMALEDEGYLELANDIRSIPVPAQQTPEPIAREIDEILNQLEEHSPNWVRQIRAYIALLRGTRNRSQQTGRYQIEAMDRVCVCGATFGQHIAEAPHEYDKNNCLGFKAASTLPSTECGGK